MSLLTLVTILQHFLPAPEEIIKPSIKNPVENCVSPSFKRKEGHEHSTLHNVDTLTLVTTGRNGVGTWLK